MFDGLQRRVRNTAHWMGFRISYAVANGVYSLQLAAEQVGAFVADNIDLVLAGRGVGVVRTAGDLTVNGNLLAEKFSVGSTALPFGWTEIRYGYNGWILKSYAADILYVSGQKNGCITQSGMFFGWAAPGLLDGANPDTTLYRGSAGRVDVCKADNTVLGDVKLANLLFAGSTSGVATVSAPAVAGTPALTLPATSGTLALTSQITSNATGQSVVDFGAFPGADSASLVVTGLSGIPSGAKVNAWITPVGTSDHSADEHMLSGVAAFAASVVAGVGFTLSLIAGRSDTTPVGTQLRGAYGAFTVNWSY